MPKSLDLAGILAALISVFVIQKFRQNQILITIFAISQ